MKTAKPLVAELNRTRRIGAEFEMTVPLVGTGSGSDVQRTLAQVLSANGLRAIARPYDHSPLPTGVDLAVEYDSSVRGETRYAGIQFFPVEVKTRILNGIDDWEAIVPKALDIVRYMGARVNASCGHHVHLSFDEVAGDPRVIRSLYNLVHRIEPVLFGLLAPSRRTSAYAHPLADRTRMLHGCKTLGCFERALAGWDRYNGLNLKHLFSGSPRVEFRYHQGTLDATKARYWLRFLLRLMDHAVTRNCQAASAQLGNDRCGIEKVLVSCGLKVNSRIYTKVSPELRETGRFILRRWKGFNSTAPSSASESEAA